MIFCDTFTRFLHNSSCFLNFTDTFIFTALAKISSIHSKTILILFFICTKFFCIKFWLPSVYRRESNWFSARVLNLLNIFLNHFELQIELFVLFCYKWRAFYTWSHKHFKKFNSLCSQASSGQQAVDDHSNQSYLKQTLVAINENGFKGWNSSLGKEMKWKLKLTNIWKFSK